MALDNFLDGMNKKLAQTLGHVTGIEKSIDHIVLATTGKLKTGMANLTGVSSNRFSPTGIAGGTSVMPTSMAKVTVPGGGGGEGGGSRLPVPVFGGQPSGGGGGSQYTGPSRGVSGGAVAAGVATAAWTGTPGVRDAVAYQSALFPVAFATTGRYDNKQTGQRILNGINGGASSPFDPTAAAAAMTYNGYTMNMGRTADRMLTSAGFMYQMTGMNNVASVMGSMALSQGTSGVSDKLMSIGITTVGPSGNPKDIGAIIDQLWQRWYPTGKVSEAQLDRDLAMGYVGADLQAAFGSNPALYQQAVMMLRLKAKEGGRSGIRMGLKSGKNSALEVAKKYGLTEYNSPMAALGDVNTSQSKLLMESSEGLLSGFVGGTNMEQAASSAASALIEFTGPLGDATMALKGFTQAVGSSPTAGPLASLAISAVTSLFSGGGTVSGIGGSTADNITARLSKGEYVINARAAKHIGKNTLDRLNAMGHAFGSGFASPSHMFAGGGEVNGADVVAEATKYTGVPYRHTGSKASPENGWDCSTFTNWVYKQFGVTLPTYSDDYLNVGSPVDRNDLQPGDILLWNTNSDKKTGHVSIYAGNGEHVHAANADVGTVRSKISQWYWDRYVGARRVAGNTLSSPSGPGTNASNSDTDPRNQQDPGLMPAGQIGGTVLYAKSFSSAGGVSIASMGKLGGLAGSFSASPIMASAVGGNQNSLLNNMDGVFDEGGGNFVNERRKKTGTAKNDLNLGTEGQVDPKVDNSMTRESFASTILGAIGAASTALTKEAMLTWMSHEGGHWKNSARYNPLNTSKVMDGNDKSINSHGVKAYSDWQEGVDATLATLRLGNYGYPEIIRAFQDGKDIKAIYTAINKSQWGTKTLPGYSHGVDYVSKDQVAQLHQGELVMPASVAQDFRDALQGIIKGGSAQDVNITLNIERASDAEAERFARKVMALLKQEQRMERIRTS